jgi:inorganic pyrophosphatase
MADYGTIEPIDAESGNVNVIIETPKGSRHKYKYEEAKKVFKLSKTMPSGMTFPFDFGYIPSTLAPDGDPLDILLLMEEPVFAGCLVEVRLLGVIKAQQTPKGEKMRRNDRLIGVFTKSVTYAEHKSISDLGKRLLDEIEHFFISYHQISGNVFKPIGRAGPREAGKLLKESSQRFRKERPTSGQ